MRAFITADLYCDAHTLMLMLGRPVERPCERVISARVALITDSPARRDIRHPGMLFQAAITRTVVVQCVVLPLHSAWKAFRDSVDSESSANDWYALCHEHAHLHTLRLEQLKEDREDA